MFHLPTIISHYLYISKSVYVIGRSHLKPLFKYPSHIILVLLYPSQLCLRKSSQPLYDLLKWFQLYAASCQVLLSIGCTACISRYPGRLEIISFKVPRTFSGTQGLNSRHESNCPKCLWHLQYKSSITLNIISKKKNTSRILWFFPLVFVFSLSRGKLEWPLC